MEIWELFIIAIGVSMDALAIAICKGLSVEKLKKKHFIVDWGGYSDKMKIVLN